MPEFDNEFADWLLSAVEEESASRPRTLQKTLGPSSVGGCREFIRATVAGDPGIPERPRGIDAAWVGTVGGDALEEIFARRLGAKVQVPFRVTLPRTGLVVVGSGDAVFVDKNMVIDLKSKDGFTEVEKDGASLENLVQLSVYILAGVQMGLLTEGAEGRLVYWDRRGVDKVLKALVLTYDAALRFIDIAETRLLEVQDVIERGSPEEARWGLRDKSPSLCHYTQCPFRAACWGDSEHRPTGAIEGEDEIALVTAYIRARAEEKGATAWKASAKEDLRPIAGGITPKIEAEGVPENDGWIVTWRGNTLNVTPA